MKLELERKDRKNESETLQTPAGGTVTVTPPIDEDYWIFRVRVSENQAIVGFPKFFTIGIGFQQEEDWNTNLPYSSTAKEILDHIWHNRGTGNDGAEFKKRCLKAIEMIQEAAPAALGRDKA